MDREGFDLIDKQYQMELAEAKRQLIEKWDQLYTQKSYTGTREMQAEARKKDKEDKQAKITQELEEKERLIDLFHFGEQGRNGMLAALKQQEEKQARTKKLFQKIIDRQKDIKSGRGD